jgi:hypothetical protein
MPAAGRAGAGMLDYLKRAFLWRWNLLALLGAGLAAVLSPWPDALLPLVGAGELLFLGALVSVPRFRQAVDADVADRARAGATRGTATSLTALLVALPADARQRFTVLRQRCLEMRAIAQGGQPAGVGDGATDLWTPALDRLLYGFLRLLDQQGRLLRFLRTTSEGELSKGLDAVKARLAQSQTAQDDRMARSLQDSVTIAEQRLDNYRKAMKNAEFAATELDRVEAKIRSLAELSVNRQDPDALSVQVDAAADSMHHTEATLNQLQQIIGGSETLDDVPPILDPITAPGQRDTA